MLAAGPLLLCRGEALSYADREGGFWGRHPRSVVGVTRQGEAVMIVVDGRFPGQAAGMTIGELIYLVRQLGLYSALNLDGGGSSTLWCEEAGVVNRPSDNQRFDHEGELHRGRGGVTPPFPIGKPRRSVASAFRRISEMPPPFPHLRKGGNSVFSRGAECAVISVSVCLMPAVSRLRLLGFLNFVKNYC